MPNNAQMCIRDRETTLPLKSIASLCQFILDSDISRTLYHNNFISCEDEDSCINPEDRSEILDRQFNNSQNINLVEHVSYIAAIKTAGIEFNKNYAETKNLMDGQRGNGYGAEYGNNTFDRLTGKEVEMCIRDSSKSEESNSRSSSPLP